MSGRRTWLALIPAAVLALAGSGCNLFDTRDPEGGGTGTDFWIPPTRPEIIVQNLLTSLEQGSFGDYQRTFAPDFEFVPDGVDVTQLGIERPGEPVYESWNRDVETQVAETIFGTAQSLDLRLTFDEEQLLDEGRLHKYTYILTLETGQGVHVYQGQAWFEIVQQSNGDWLIAGWQDVTTPVTVESWGRLKGRNRQL
jgi:hypothetical protein